MKLIKKEKLNTFGKQILSIFLIISIFFPTYFISSVQTALAQSTGGGFTVICIASPHTILEGQSTNWIASTSGGVSPYTYLWSSGDTTISDRSVYRDAGTYLRRVTATDSTGATARGECSVVVQATSSTNNSTSTSTATTTNTTNNSGGTRYPNESSEGGSEEGGSESEGVEEDSPAERMQGRGQEDNTEKSNLDEVIGEVAECALEEILGGTLGSLLQGLASEIFGGIQEAANAAIAQVGGMAAKAVGGAVGKVAGDALGAAAGGLLSSLIGGAAGGAIPVITITTDKEIQGLAAKSIGNVREGIFQTPPIDAIAHCLTTAIQRHIKKMASQWLHMGFGGNPTFVENYPRLLRDTSRLGAEAISQELTSSPCPVDQKAGKDIQTEKESTQSGATPTECSGVEEAESSTERTNLWGGPNNPVLKYWQGRSDADAKQRDLIKSTELEILAQNGQIGVKDGETGDTLLSPHLTYELAAREFLGPLNQTQYLLESPQFNSGLEMTVDELLTGIVGYSFKDLDVSGNSSLRINDKNSGN